MSADMRIDLIRRVYPDAGSLEHVPQQDRKAVYVSDHMYGDLGEQQLCLDVVEGRA
jgi:hypothetical protein